MTIPFKFDDVHSFQKEGCIVSLNNQWGMIDRRGNLKLDNEFGYLAGFAFGLGIASAKTGSASGADQKFIIDIKGNKIVDIPSKWSWVTPVSERLILIGNISGYPGEGIFGFMDLQGTIKSEPQFYTNSDSLYNIGTFINGKLSVITKKGKRGYVNEEGEFQPEGTLESGNENDLDVVLQRPFDEVLSFSEGLAVARKGKLWGVIDENNREITDFKFGKRFVRSTGDTGFFFSDNSPRYSCGLIGICEERDTIYSGYMDKDGKIAIPLTFRIAEPFFVRD